MFYVQSIIVIFPFSQFFNFLICLLIHPFPFFLLLVALQLPLGKTTAMHIMARETLPEPNSQGL